AHPGAPVACTIERGGMAERADDFREAFTKLVSSRRTPQGFRWLFRDEPGFEAALCDLAAREHTCCVFLYFAISREDGHLVWDVKGHAEAATAVDVFYALPQTIHQDVEVIKRYAEKAGLPFTNDRPTKSPCC
ncbi:MAG TPA: hypothetical protein VMF89_17085, partial [Polyangiales bacterium]|nr:hypothetical protein [Polyangiales bacterium]